MGTTVTKSGVSVQFCDPEGNIDGQPIFSTFVQILGQPREDVIKRTGVEPTPVEKDYPGSDDWLTLIAIADSQERLSSLVSQSGLPVTDAQTSGSSRRVEVRLHVGLVHLTFRNRVTIASGPIICFRPPIMNVLHIKVLGEEAVMKPDHPLWPEFKAQGPFAPP